MGDYLPILTIAVSIILVVLVLMQQRGTALGSAFGQEGGFYATRRGIQKKLFVATIIFGALFILLAILNLIA
ncbi:MAG: preprotein translocase subunit SecG [Candidatus Pacebacteria bacterium]|nr:preprotein translocase subunit SecG [Candidatus Paceibacterota bacterium]